MFPNGWFPQGWFPESWFPKDGAEQQPRGGMFGAGLLRQLVRLQAADRSGQQDQLERRLMTARAERTLARLLSRKAEHEAELFRQHKNMILATYYVALVEA